MEKNRRVLKVEREWRQLIAEYFISHLRDEVQGLVSVTRVEASPDLRSGKVFVSHLGGEGADESIIDLLESRRSQIQEHIGNELRMRYCPRLTFILDRGFEQMLKVETILREIHRQD